VPASYQFQAIAKFRKDRIDQAFIDQTVKTMMQLRTKSLARVRASVCAFSLPRITIFAAWQSSTRKQF
jgi:hypothetical protein